MNIYIVYRQKGKRGKEYLSRDTARTFWWPKLVDKWVKFFTNIEEANAAINSSLVSGMKYGIKVEDWSAEKIGKHSQPPYEDVTHV